MNNADGITTLDTCPFCGTDPRAGVIGINFDALLRLYSQQYLGWLEIDIDRRPEDLDRVVVFGPDLPDCKPCEHTIFCSVVSSFTMYKRGNDVYVPCPSFTWHRDIGAQFGPEQLFLHQFVNDVSRSRRSNKLSIATDHRMIRRFAGISEKKPDNPMGTRHFRIPDRAGYSNIRVRVVSDVFFAKSVTGLLAEIGNSPRFKRWVTINGQHWLNRFVDSPSELDEIKQADR